MDAPLGEGPSRTAIPAVSPSSVEDRLPTLSRRPGVYLFKNADGKIVYIGKAKVLKNRVRSYFQSSRNIDKKTRRMMAQAVDFDLMATESEVEALILEANLVHQNKPRYNVMLKDDTHFP